ncbi:MAG: metal-dependent transcriptional regulator [Spirochaetes bacterium]|nr:metal-dependent transcriptional regulator [Spirochaetota bacterium]
MTDDTMLQGTSLSSSLVAYIAAIDDLSLKNGVARVRDIAGARKVKMPSVTAAMRRLSEKRLVRYERYGFVALTAEGGAVAAEIRHRRGILGDFLRDVLMLEISAVDRQAKELECLLSPEAFRRLHGMICFVRKEGLDGNEWVRRLAAAMQGDGPCGVPYPPVSAPHAHPH